MKTLFLIAMTVGLMFFVNTANAQLASIKSYQIKDTDEMILSVNQDGSLNFHPAWQKDLSHMEGKSYCCNINGEPKGLYVVCQGGKLYLCEKVGEQYVAVYRPFTNFALSPVRCDNSLSFAF